MTQLYGGVEAGGTKVVCAVGSGPSDLRAETRFATTSPDETIRKALEFFEQAQQRFGALAALGIASFGPVNVDPTSPTYGAITSTPKAGWANFNLLGALRKALPLPIGFDTDVNGAALGEWRWGAAQGLDTFIYITVGTGIGGGGLANGRLMHGMLHPEMGHMRIPHDWDRDPFPGVCPYHGDCLEGLATGPAMAGRWGQPAETLPANHPAWELEAHYLALGLANLICILSPQRIILGGGVMSRLELFPLVRAGVQQALNGYIRAPQIEQEIEAYIVPPALGARAGICGALALAQAALAADHTSKDDFSSSG